MCEKEKLELFQIGFLHRLSIQIVLWVNNHKFGLDDSGSVYAAQQHAGKE